MFTSPSPGISMIMVPMRANTSRKAAASAGRNETSMRMLHRTNPGYEDTYPPMIRDEMRSM